MEWDTGQRCHEGFKRTVALRTTEKHGRWQEGGGGSTLCPKTCCGSVVPAKDPFKDTGTHEKLQEQDWQRERREGVNPKPAVNS